MKVLVSAFRTRLDISSAALDRSLDEKIFLNLRNATLQTDQLPAPQTSKASIIVPFASRIKEGKQNRELEPQGEKGRPEAKV